MALDNLDPTPGADKWNAQGYPKLNAAIDKINEIDADIVGGATDQVLKKTNGSDYNYEWSNSILAASGTPNLKTKVVEIGDWNMDTDTDKIVSLGVSNGTIRSVWVLIRNDANNDWYPLDRYDNASFEIQGGVRIAESFVGLVRRTGGFFDSSTFDSTSYNRGWVTIIYEG